jgi:hypothetical protein
VYRASAGGRTHLVCSPLRPRVLVAPLVCHGSSSHSLNCEGWVCIERVQVGARTLSDRLCVCSSPHWCVTVAPATHSTARAGCVSSECRWAHAPCLLASACARRPTGVWTRRQAALLEGPRGRAATARAPGWRCAPAAPAHRGVMWVRSGTVWMYRGRMWVGSGTMWPGDFEVDWLSV